MIDNLTARVERLERENRRWRVAGLVAVLLMAGVAFVAADKPDVQDVVRAHKFLIVDADGKPAGGMEPGNILIANKRGDRSGISCNDEMAVLNLSFGTTHLQGQAAGTYGVWSISKNGDIVWNVDGTGKKEN
ncbi:MAG TPA: hypothetical protein VIK18_09295 [Pirellulales bacterium]